MQSSKRQLKTLYFPGLISLLGLPLLLTAYLFCTNSFKQERAMDVAWISDQWIKETNVDYKGNRFFEKYLFSIPKRNYITIEITSNPTINSFKIELIARLTKRLITKKDSVTGYKIKFTKSALYASLVKVLDICRLRDTSGFLSFPYHDDIYIAYKPHHIYMPLSPKPRVFICGTGLAERRGYQRSHAYQQLAGMGDNLLKSWPVFLMLIPMIYFAFRKKRMI